jgi:hypothetical protein
MSLSNKPRITVCVAGQILNECALSCVWLAKTDIEQHLDDINVKKGP